MPTDVDDDVLHRLTDDRAFALGQRRVLDKRKLNKRIFLSSRPIAVKLLRHLHDVSRIDIARQNQR
jgi:hypothetical protein